MLCKSYQKNSKTDKQKLKVFHNEAKKMKLFKLVLYSSHTQKFTFPSISQAIFILILFLFQSNVYRK